MRSAFLLICLLFLATASAAQSGRNVSPTPAPSVIPVPSPAAQDPDLPYSESQPKTDRPDRRLARPGPASGANPDHNAAGTDGEVVKVETSLITIPVSVFDRNGLYIPGLKLENFSIFEDGREQQIAYFGTDDKPVTVALLLDTSPSTHYRIEEIHKAAEAFVNQLGPEDSIIVIEFNSSVKIQSSRTRDREKTFQGIERAQYGNGTSLYNAVDEALRKQLSKVEGRKAVVLFTDGVDTTSKKNTYDGTVAYAEESDSLVFPIYYDTFDENQSSDPLLLQIGTRAEDYALGKKYLEELADVTGGRVFHAESTPGGLTRAFEGIAEELRHQYNIGYVPDIEGQIGQRKLIKVRVDRSNLILRARDSYVVGSARAPTKKKAK
jgi:VWFA-related protein